MKKFLLVFLLLLGFAHHADAQRIDYENTSKYFWGLNVGHVWHSSDVKNIKGRFPLGAGLIVGRSFNQDYGKLLSFDLRFRYLGGRWLGHDADTTTALHGNHAYKPTFDTLLYGLKNFSSTQHSFDIELSLHYNRLKETSGIDPYIFAGLGIVGTKTRGDIGATKDMSVKDLDFATPLDKNELGEPYSESNFQTNILPSLGIGIGYYFNSRFSLGIEHRSTFFRGDYFDGTPLKQDGTPSKIENDIYHYTSIYFKWYFKPKKEREVTDNTPIKPNVPIVKDPDINDNTGPIDRTPPVVVITNPSVNRTQTSNPHYTIRADIQHVSSGSNLTFRQNGRILPSFIYNPNTGVFEGKVTLQLGENRFHLYGVNSVGNDSDETIIIYKEETRALPPIVNIVDPVSSPHSTNKLNYIVKANIQNIVARNQITVMLNNKPFSDYSFVENGTVNFTANINLNAGINTLKIYAKNDVGTDTDETVIIYTREPNPTTGYPPVVTINTPSVSPYRTTKEVEGVVATIQNITSKQNLEVRVNGVSTSNFSYNSSQQRVTMNTVLVPGNNSVRIIATNDYGMDMGEVNIVYSKVVQDPPYVEITTPFLNPYHTTQDNEEIIASIQHISTKENIEVRVNGVKINNFYFNAALKTLQFNANLAVGSNTVFVQARNEFGNSIDETEIIYRKPVAQVSPTVYITKPTSNPYSTSQSTEDIVANTTNIDNKLQVEVKVNGQQTNNFAFNTATKQVSFNANLSAGSNIVSIKVTNSYGSASDDRQIIYRKPATGNPPIVNITKPIHNPLGTTKDKEEVLATISNVNDKSQIEVKVNGQVTNNFTFNTTTNQVRLIASLSLGSNSVNVKASNAYGSASEDRVIIYKEPVVVKSPPTVVITKPVTSPYNTSTSPESIEATTVNISNKSQIAVTINGQATNDFNFSFITKTIQLSPQLTSGTNVIKITVTNNDGSDFAETFITYRKKETPRPPLVSFIAPLEANQTVINKSYNMIAKVENITQKSEIQLYFNQNLVNSSEYNFNTTNNTVVYQSELNPGNNIFRISAQNKDGAHQAETNINYKAITIDAGTINVERIPCEEKDYPGIQYISPKNTNTLVSSNHAKIEANLINIKSRNQITVYYNGLKKTDFNYHVPTNTFSDDITFQEGINTYTVMLDNACESIVSELTFNYTPLKCGVELDLFGDGELCLTTPNGQITKDDLLNNNSFVYNGPATNLYFKARNHGVAIVNNQEFPIIKDNFYHFRSNATVNIQRINNIWVICVETQDKPVYGLGRSKPTNPCQAQNKEPQKPVRDKKPVREPQKPVKEPQKPVQSTEPGTKAPTRTPTRTIPSR